MVKDSPRTTAKTRLESVKGHLASPHAESSATSSPSSSSSSASTTTLSSFTDQAVEEAIAGLASLFPADQLSLDLATRNTHGSSWGSFIPPTPPTAVLHALSTTDVVKAVKFAVKNRWNVIPTGGRTALEGQFIPTCCNPPQGDRWDPTGSARADENGLGRGKGKGKEAELRRPTLHVSLSHMNKVIKVYEDDFQAIVEPGVGWVSLNKYLAERNIKLHFPVDPAPGAEFGGMVGVAGSGTNTVGYGTLRGEWITSLEVVLMNGSVIRTKGTNRARKSSTGWDTARLFLGSEGTLGIVTRITVRLAPLLPLRVALTSFPNVSRAVATSTAIIRHGLTPTSLELLDGTSIRGLNLANLLEGRKLEERPTVLMRFSGATPASIEQVLEKVKEIVKENEGDKLWIATSEQENELIWNARKSQYWSQQLLIGEGCRTLITDICVPLSRVAEFVDRSDVFVRESGLFAPIVAHIGDGNIHRAILFKDSNSTATPPEVEELAKKLALLAIELEGTCSGEHGIGITKRGYLKRELGEGTLSLMRRIKRELDPLNLLNPGKILFEEGEEEWK
ncbi:FAD-binding oxidoreductase [Sporobolomyces salmoneus]|uniref:FAD-binding oxidoreductase n=1 Tax=Sporobolomyces salmoneus TaxID=183962 RepID=UPI00317B0DE0